MLELVAMMSSVECNNETNEDNEKVSIGLKYKNVITAKSNEIFIAYLVIYRINVKHFIT